MGFAIFLSEEATMFEKNYYTLRGIADELNIGESTIQYWQDQYDSWIPCKDNDKEKWYPRQAISILRFIMESANSGMNEADIEKELTARFPVAKDFYKQEASLNNYERGLQVMSGDSVSGALKGLIEGLSGQQMRIADAQERRAAAEERKAAAMEKRAEAQKLMADALNNVASALKHITTRGTERDSWNIPKMVNSLNREVLPELIEASQEVFLQDQNEQEMQEKVLDSLLNDISEGDESSGFSDGKDFNELLKDSAEEIVPHMDDLSELVDQKPEEKVSELDDLSDLLESASAETAPELDDLSELVDQKPEEKVSELDDLSDLLESASAETAPELDDLSELVDQKPEEKVPELDDLSDLLEVSSEKVKQEKDDNHGMMDMPEKLKQTALSPGEQTKKLPGDYKSKIIALIIQLKENKGMGVDDVTEYMNKKGYKTISGKGKWNSRTIDQIFEHIKLVRSGNG
ncbi:MAG: hypothetical protein C0403_19180 [Desulfobacterium sp.]|nr:hypothetical protein [Desulfobacterium sp.]